MKTIFLLLLSLISIASSIAQTTFYVDATNGSDVNNGTSILSAWKTIDKVNQQSFIAGDSILFKRGEIWNGERLYIENVSASLNNRVVYGAYGNGLKPIINSVTPQAHNWINTTGNIWKATNPPLEHPERMLINGIERLRANIPNELDGVTYYWLYDNSNDLYVYSDTNPNNSVFEYSTDFPLIIGWSNHITVRDLDFQGGWTSIYINTQSKNIHLDSLTIGKYAREGLVISSESAIQSEYPQNIVVENCLFDSHFEFDYSTSSIYSENSDRGSSDGYRANFLSEGEVVKCNFKNWGHASISLGGVNVSNISIHDNYLSSPDICYGGRMAVEDGANNNELFNNQIINTSVQSQLGGQNNHYHHNIFYGTRSTPLVPTIIDAGVEIQSYDNTEITGNRYENNNFINIEGPGFRISGNNSNDIHDNIIQNNIIYNCGSLANQEGIVVEDNLYELTYDNTFQNNLIYNATTTQTCNFRGTLYDVASFNALTGIDGYVLSQNISENPQFINLNTADYHLQLGSPCIDAGTNALAISDFEGNIIPSVGTSVDIGIFEYQKVLSIESLSSSEEISIYPNPATDYVVLSGKTSKIKKIQIVNTNGEVVVANLSASGKIDLSLLLNGIYFMEIELTDRLITKKIIVIE